MTPVDPGRPAATEHIPYYEPYIRLVPDGNIIESIERSLDATIASLATLTSEQVQRRTTPEGWNALEVLGHLADTERVLSYRALRFARGDRTPLEGVEFDSYVAAAGFSGRTLAAVVEEFVSVRRATIALLRHLDAAAWTRDGLADGQPISVRALAFIVAGHEIQHIGEVCAAIDAPVA